jgi:hypothetical protein
LIVLRVHPLYGLFLMDYLDGGSTELIQILESLLEMLSGGEIITRPMVGRTLHRKY